MYLLNNALGQSRESGRFLDLGTSPVLCQKRVCSEHVAKLREDP